MNNNPESRISLAVVKWTGTGGGGGTALFAPLQPTLTTAMGFINPGRNNNDRIAGVRLRDRPSCPPIKGGRRPPASAAAAFSSPPKRPPKRGRPSSAPHPHTAPPPSHLSRFESLPPEILHNIFTHSHNLHLARASPHLTHTLAARSLQLSYVRAHATDAAALSHAFTLRFFTRSFLTLWEHRFAHTLDCHGTHVPLRALSLSHGLGAALISRGATLAAEERDAHLGVLHGALKTGDSGTVRLLVETAGLRPDAQSLVLAVGSSSAAVGVDVCAVLVAHGADVRDVRVWREAVALGRSPRGEEVVGWLLEKASPPGEVMGELSRLYG